MNKKKSLRNIIPPPKKKQFRKPQLRLNFLSFVKLLFRSYAFQAHISQNYFKKYIHLTFELAPYPGYSLP